MNVIELFICFRPEILAFGNRIINYGLLILHADEKLLRAQRRRFSFRRKSNLNYESVFVFYPKRLIDLQIFSFSFLSDCSE